MNDNGFYTYSSQENARLPDFQEDERLNHPKYYQPSEALEKAVDVAIFLGKPLLLTGEPGTGKTQLAHSVAHKFGDQPLIFNTRTSSTATDLFYRYDALKHFQYTQNSSNKELTDDEIENRFIRYQALGEAIRDNKRRVVLIDEIDKAPRDLPNDILNVLEDMSFTVAEVNKTYPDKPKPELRPIIIMTSNSEKNLPDAFLRRCVYFHIEFPNEKKLLEILVKKVAGETYKASVLEKKVIPHFMAVRKLAKRKKPATSELLYWISVLDKIDFSPDKLPETLEGARTLAKDDLNTLKMSYAVLIKNDEDLKILNRMLKS